VLHRNCNLEGGIMFVGRRMTRNLITVNRDTSVLKVKNLLKEHNIDQMPVVEGKKLVGIVTDRDIRENSASPASSLSVHELNYLLSEMKTEEIMTKEVYTVTPSTTIEEAAKLINEKRVNSLPVVLGDELLGIITTCDLLNVLLDFMGVDISSSRCELILSSNIGEIAKVAGIINEMGLTILSIMSTIDKNTHDSRTTLIRVNADSSEKLCSELEKAGYRVNNEYQVIK
jgi:acetoin utilization protein AcuB